MQTLRLARIAAEAEGLRLRRQAQRTVLRVVVGVIALMFLAWGLAFAHIAAWYWLRQGAGLAPPGAAAAVAGGDLVCAAVLALLAARSSPGRIELEALLVRQRALGSVTSSVALASTLASALRLAANLWRRNE